MGAIAPDKRQRMTIGDVAEALAEMEQGTGTTQRVVVDITNPFGFANAKLEDEPCKVVARWRRRLYDAVQAQEVGHHRQDSSDRAQLFFHWSDVMSWYRKRWTYRRPRVV